MKLISEVKARHEVKAKKQTNDKKKITKQGFKRGKNKPQRQRKSKGEGRKGTGQQKGKKDNNETKKKRKSKTKTGEFKKFKLAGRKKKTSVKTSLTSKQRQCQEGITPPCMEVSKEINVFAFNIHDYLRLPRLF